MTTGVDVIVVSYESRDLIVDCCRSALAGGANGIIVVDNASSDGSADAVAGVVPEARLIRSASNEGFARAVNRGLELVREPFVLLLNPDARLTGAALEHLVGTLSAAPAVAAVGPRIRDPRGLLELSAGRTMTPLGDLRVQLLERARGDGTGLVGRWLEWRYARPRQVRSLSGACLLLRTDALAAIGGFDERFFLYAEDVDLCTRLVGAGWGLLYEPGAEVVHVRGASARSSPELVERAWRRSQMAFYHKHSPRWLPLLRLWLRLRYGWRSRVGSTESRRRARSVWQWLRETEL